jgi:hypothetical protein
MPAVIALSKPYLTWWDKENPGEDEPLITCDYAILPTGSMLQADQIMYGQLGSQAVPSTLNPKAMVVSSERKMQFFPTVDADAETIGLFVEEMTVEFLMLLDKLKLLEPALAEQSDHAG